MSENTSWLGNVPDTRIKHTSSLPKSQVDRLESLLEFIQRSQPQASMDHLFEDVLETYLRRRNKSFPVPEEHTSLKVTIPRELKQSLEEQVELARGDDPRAEIEHLLHFAVDSYFKRRSELLTAWRADERDQDTSGDGGDEEVGQQEKKSTSAPGRESVTQGDEVTTASSRTEEVVDRVRKSMAARQAAQVEDEAEDKVI
jgi:hypothetical protein